MDSRVDIVNQFNSKIAYFASQTISRDGEGNLFVGGEADDTVVNYTDSSTILTGEGDDVVISTGDNNELAADSGNNQIKSTGDGNTISVANGQNKVISEGDNNTINTNDSNSQIKSTGDNNSINANGGTNLIIVDGDANELSLVDSNNQVVITGDHNETTGSNSNNAINSTGDYNTIDLESGNNVIHSFGNHNNISTGAGIDDILAIGDYNNVNAGDGNNRLVFYGNNLNIAVGNGNSYVASLDFAIMNGLYTDLESYIDENLFTRQQTNLVSSNNRTDVIKEESHTEYSDSTSKIYDQLSDKEKAYIEANNIDLSEKLPNGKPKYIIAKGKSDGKYHVYKSTSTATTYVTILGAGSLPQGNNYLYLQDGSSLNQETITVDATTTTTRTTQSVTVNVYEDVEQTVAAGLNNVNISLGNGSSVVQANIASGEITGGNGGHQVLQVSGLIMDEDIVDRRTEEVKNGKEETKTTTTSSKETIIGTSLSGSYTTGSPLIIDFNQDGKVSAEHGVGIDVDGNGTADGCAAGGDKMLAMTDINGNGTIDGSEVFGNETVNPFTGEKLNAANGFEALKMVAEAAKAATGINCIDENGLVDLKALNEALQTKGIKLGFVSDENNTTVEDLSKVAYIDTKNYTEEQQSGKIQHNQQGTSIFEDGSTAKVDDVWFELTGLNNPFLAEIA